MSDPTGTNPAYALAQMRRDNAARMADSGIGQGANDARVPTSRPSVTSRAIPPEHEAARLRAALKALLLEARSGQHRRDRQNQKCPPMEAAIERAEELLRTRGGLRG